MAGDFKKLIVWQRAMDFAEAIYQSTADWPKTEIYGLTQQLRRACVSVASNIAEGHGRASSKELTQYLRIANGSRQEAETQLLIAERLGFLDGTMAKDLYGRSDEIGRLIFGLIRSVRSQDP